MSNKDELEKLVVELIQRENKTDWRFEIGRPVHKEGNIWVVLVRWITPDGDLLDGPGRIYVDEVSLEAWFV